MVLTGKELENAKRWMITLLSRGNVLKNNNYTTFAWFDRQCAEAICEEIKYRNWTFFTKKLDDCLKLIADGDKLRTAVGGHIKRSAEWCAEVIGWFCETNKIMWDDSNKTKYELDAVKDTILGKALFEHGCFLNTKPQAPQAQPTTQTRSASTKQPGQPPVSNYKSSGGHSQDIPNLVNSQKDYLGGPVYCITADKVGKNTPRAFITPLSVSGSNIKTVSQASAETIKFGSGNGYTDCTLFFDTMTDAQVFFNYCVSTFGSKYTNIQICQNKNADKNGYFLVSTSIGRAYIKASVLNEELEEKLTEEKSSTDRINDVEVYDEWLRNSVC